VSQRWALLLQYDGTEFAGSQWQPNRPTVQGVLQSALESLTGSATRVSMAGRTDAGVHAAGQVASFVALKSIEAMPTHRWIRGLNHFLPASVAVQAATPVSDGFDPRRDAISRLYTYDLRLSHQRQPLWERRAWIVPPPFHSETARNALAVLVGSHDFAAFTPPSEERSTVRSLHEASLTAEDESVRLQFRADSFVQHQVRRMVGAVIEVARCRASLEAFRDGFESARAGSMGPTAPACGLSLAEVEYERPLFNTHLPLRSSVGS
jgi:tRNA pseudouridine38-40 synthase